MQIPARLLQALAILENGAKAYLAQQPGMLGERISYAHASSLYEKVAMRWQQCLERYIPNTPEFSAQRLEAQKKVLSLYGQARGLFFKAINEDHLDLTEENCRKFLELEVNAISCAVECNEINQEKYDSMRGRVEHIFKLAITGKYLAYHLKIGSLFLNAANRLASLDVDKKLISSMYKLGLDALPVYIEKESIANEGLKKNFYNSYGIPNIAIIDLYNNELNRLYGEVSVLMEYVRRWGLEDDNNIGLLICRQLEVMLAPKMDAMAELQMELFDRGYNIAGIESIEPKPVPRSTLRNRKKY